MQLPTPAMAIFAFIGPASLEFREDAQKTDHEKNQAQGVVDPDEWGRHPDVGRVRVRVVKKGDAESEEYEPHQSQQRVHSRLLGF